MNNQLFSELLELAKTLRGPNGCPWDKKQTIKSMLPHLKEEVDEVVQASDNQDHQNLKEELGDVLFQLIMINQIAEEKGHFTMQEVLENIKQKIITRHTWVFGDDQASTPEEAIKLWKRNKAKERT